MKEVNSKTQKESQSIQEASATIEGIKEEIMSASFEISVKYSNDKPRPQRTFQQEPGPILMKECDQESKLRRGLLNPNDPVNIP